MTRVLDQPSVRLPWIKDEDVKDREQRQKMTGGTQIEQQEALSEMMLLRRERLDLTYKDYVDQSCRPDLTSWELPIADAEEMAPRDVDMILPSSSEQGIAPRQESIATSEHVRSPAWRPHSQARVRNQLPQTDGSVPMEVDGTLAAEPIMPAHNNFIAPALGAL